ncbi:15740_t:CDS:10 [Entrophospora sp. SA101]|nr:14241_t:CDS:10 [Entrophospora sp. SA101]CAJ0627662.1 15740_t:CDS:10 [Entrophospora sp. SA101]CAJ0828957.1 3230_t:CDS:10 [Entrophospora sp. SA101]CAJ0840884.1 12779_t:CDS:10 [Entrophospora sp. SA101]CAJ0901836.1 3526_t:CDS:10 [Entrophospora sp. SA101]
MSLKPTSEQINYLILRYFRLELSTSAFQAESHPERAGIKYEDVEPGALVNIVHRGLQYCDLQDGASAECIAPLQLIGSHQSNSSSTSMPNPIKSSSTTAIAAVRSITPINNVEAVKVTDDDDGEPLSEIGDNQSSEEEGELISGGEEHEDNYSTSPNRSQEVSNEKPEHKRLKQKSSKKIQKIPIKDSILLEGHKGPVSLCLDGKLEIWSISDSQETLSKPVAIENNFFDNPTEHYICALNWNPNGKLISTSYFNGLSSTFTIHGLLRTNLEFYSLCFIILKWNPKGNYILTGCEDGNIILWDPLGNAVRLYEMHNDRVTSIDWKSDGIFATSSKDAKIFICDVNQSKPLKNYVGYHEDKVNEISWNPTKKYLASCSDDCTVKLWVENKKEPIQTIEHDAKVESISWCPIQQQSDEMNHILATYSADHKIKIWNAMKNECLHIFRTNNGLISSFDFHPNGQIISAGSNDNKLFIYNVESGEIVKAFGVDEKILCIKWNITGSLLSLSLNNGNIIILKTKALME